MDTHDCILATPLRFHGKASEVIRASRARVLTIIYLDVSPAER